jgi:hypothetical protein
MAICQKVSLAQVTSKRNDIESRTDCWKVEVLGALSA